jgi:hypothetical protein
MSHTRPRVPCTLLTLALLVAIPFASLPARAAETPPAIPPQTGASLLHPWAPAHSDSVEVWAAEARAMFQANSGDSVTGENFLAYQKVGNIGRRMLQELGRDHMAQVAAIEPAIRALGLVVEVRTDPLQPMFLLLMVRNPFRRSAESIGFLYWWQESKLRFQGTLFTSGDEARVRIWWTGHPDIPYLCGVLDRSRDAARTPHLLLLRMSHDAQYWDVIQFPNGGPDLEHAGVAEWTDVNDDGIPEITYWMARPADSLFTACSTCPKLYTQRLFTLRDNGFQLEDERDIPSPNSAFQSFVRLLTEHKKAAAEWAARPTLVDSAVAEGWSAPRAAGAWRIEEGDAGEPWPRWLAVQHVAVAHQPRYAVHFTRRDGRWLVNQWIRERYNGPDSTLRAIYGTSADDSVRHKAPAHHAPHSTTTGKSK